jgi:sugar (pentulose or hexulose) kinase
MAEAILLGLDIGASSIKAGAFRTDGETVAVESCPNAPAPQRDGEGYFVWDSRALRGACETLLRKIAGAVERPDAIRSIAVTGFGADGAPFSASGRQLYPIISWHDSRAGAQVERLADRLGAERIYATTGYHPYPINTIGRWMWLREHVPQALAGATWLMIPDIAAHWLSGEMCTDPTSASTTMAFEPARGAWAPELFEAAGVPTELPAPLAEPGQAIGAITEAAAERAGLPAGTVLAAGGHDCEVGTFAATAALPATTFVDISGTWEMLIALTGEFSPSQLQFERGIDWERHVRPGAYLCQSLMPAGSVLAWVRDLAYGHLEDPWRRLVADAKAAEPGAGGVRLVPSFVPGMGPAGQTATGGAILGLKTTTTRGQIARAAFEALCRQLRSQIEVLERSLGRSCQTLRVLGGAQRNDFWLQLKADVTGRPVEAIDTEELTLLGAALLGGVGAGVYSSLEEAQRATRHGLRTFEPDPRLAELYAGLSAGG